MKDLSLVILSLFLLSSSPLLCAAPVDAATSEVLERIGVTKGICVVTDDPEAARAITLARASDLMIYLQVADDTEAAVAAMNIDAAGLYGTRIFLGTGPVDRLQLATNVADAVLGSSIPKEEALRVLRPEGRACIGKKVYTKDFPEGMDDWTHPYHGPDNNPQSNDTIVKAPYLTQFLVDPRYAPLPQVCVSSAGRVFKAYGHVAFKEREEPLLNTLEAYNGYNGTILWQRPLTPGYMIHRNTLIATPDRLYVGDDTSCKVIDTKTGELLDEIVPDETVAGGTFWKWMALEGDTLYAVMGEQEQRDPDTKMRREAHGWPWNPVSIGFNQPDNPWGFGKHLLAIDVKSQKVRWAHQEMDAIDTRATCMKNGRIFLFRFGSYLACIDAKSGKERWRKTPDNDPALFKALGDYSDRQDWRTNWRTAAYLKCSDDALYFAGPQVNKLVTVSAQDGNLLWENEYNNFQLILREDGLYGISGQIDEHVSQIFDPMTGEVLADLEITRRGCTRPTGACDALFFRAQGGTTRFDLDSAKKQWVSPMRPNCHDGVTIANGLLYWWPSTCDCQLSLYGVTALGPAGEFEFNPEATEDRLHAPPVALPRIAPLPQDELDWPTYRADNHGTAYAPVTVNPKANRLWTHSTHPGNAPTAPIAVAGMALFSGSDGIVRALDSETGTERWKSYVHGGVLISPTVWNGRVLVGSGDGRVYALDARTGTRIWTYRAAPVERRIPVYGALQSTWPVATGVRVQDGTAYFAAGIANYDGTHVYALDAFSGALKWQNSDSGHMNLEARTGVSVQGAMVLHDDKLYMPGGSSVSPAIYTLADGTCQNDAAQLEKCESIMPRGEDLFVIGDKVVTAGQPLYGHPDFPVADPTAEEKTLVTATKDRHVAWIDSQKIAVYNPIPQETLNNCVTEPDYKVYMIQTWGKLALEEAPLWEVDCEDSYAVAIADNAVIVADRGTIKAYNMEDGKRLWWYSLPNAPIPWGIAINRDGTVLLTLRNGQILAFG